MLNSILIGGRIRREKTTNPSPVPVFDPVTLSPVFDMDFISAYPSIMQEIPYPIGEPKILSYFKNKITLKEFLKGYANELIDDQYQIILDAKNIFEQDFLVQKYFNKSRLKKYIQTSFSSNSYKNYNDLYENIETILLTSRIFNVLQKIATNKELKSLLDLEVLTVAFYPKSEACENINSM